MLPKEAHRKVAATILPVFARRHRGGAHRVSPPGFREAVAAGRHDSGASEEPACGQLITPFVYSLA